MLVPTSKLSATVCQRATFRDWEPMLACARSPRDALAPIASSTTRGEPVGVVSERVHGTFPSKSSQKSCASGAEAGHRNGPLASGSGASLLGPSSEPSPLEPLLASAPPSDGNVPS